VGCPHLQPRGRTSFTMEILQQIGSLILQAVPTILLVLIFFLFLKSQFFGPLQKVMEERDKRIEGARKEAETARAAAEEKKKAYQEALRKARAEVYAEQDAARRAVLDERARIVREARARANERVRAAKDNLAAELAAARKQIEAESQILGTRIAQAILSSGSAPRAPKGAG
jgi:F-type H+-transporting ATPase subunit b